MEGQADTAGRADARGSSSVSRALAVPSKTEAKSFTVCGG
jgi:hypothetical protein